MKGRHPEGAAARAATWRCCPSVPYSTFKRGAAAAAVVVVVVQYTHRLMTTVLASIDFGKDVFRTASNVKVRVDFAPREDFVHYHTERPQVRLQVHRLCPPDFWRRPPNRQWNSFGDFDGAILVGQLHCKAKVAHLCSRTRIKPGQIFRIVA